MEESFLSRNYGKDYGNLYKPDSMDMGGGKGNGGRFEMQEEMPKEMPERVLGKVGGQEVPDGDFPKENGQPAFPGGMPMMGSSDVALIYTDDGYDSYKNIFENAKTDLSDGDKDRLIDSLKKLNSFPSSDVDIEEVVDVEAVIRYFVVHNFVCNFDSYTGAMIHNYYLYEKDGKLSMIPWDYNLAFGGFEAQEDATGMVNYPIDSPVSGDISSRPMIAWVFADENYTDLYHQYFAEFIDHFFASASFEDMIDDVMELIASYVKKDPTKFCSYEEFEKGIHTLKEFCLRRSESISGQLAGTIPATEQGQEQNQSVLVDASQIRLSDMGSMDGGMGGFDRKNPPGGKKEKYEEGNKEVDDRWFPKR